MKEGRFTKGVERLVNPIEVGTIHYVQSFNRFLPKKIQHKMVNASGQKTPYMGFVVEPYSFYLCYEIKDLLYAQTFLPEGFKLAKTGIFADDEPKYYAIIGCFSAHTSAFWGSRIEFYITAENLATGLMSWIICDYDTNTITYDPKYALNDPNTKAAVVTTDYSGELWVDVENDSGRKLVFNSDLKKGEMLPVNKKLWIEGNLSIAYGSNRAEKNPGLFSLMFDVHEFDQAMRIPKESLKIEVNNWFPGMLADEPSQIACFPYAQHMLSDSPGHASELQTPEEMIQAAEAADFSVIKPYSTKAIKRAFMMGSIMSTVLTLTLVILLFVT